MLVTYYRTPVPSLSLIQVRIMKVTLLLFTDCSSENQYVFSEMLAIRNTNTLLCRTSGTYFAFPATYLLHWPVLSVTPASSSTVRMYGTCRALIGLSRGDMTASDWLAVCHVALFTARDWSMPPFLLRSEAPTLGCTCSAMKYLFRVAVLNRATV